MAAGFVSALLDYAVSRGADRQALLQSAGLAPADLTDQDQRVPVLAYHTNGPMN